MAINSIRLQNFKGFKNVKLDLKPLTVLLGPNSSGKSSFGQALVALSKNNLSRDRVLSLSSEGPSINFGKYSDLIHEGSEGDQDLKVKLPHLSGSDILPKPFFLIQMFFNPHPEKRRIA